MKKIFGLMALALAVIGVSCNLEKSEIEGIEKVSGVTITAGIEGEEARTVLEGFKVYWSGKEQFKVLTTNAQTATFTANVTEPSATAVFTTTTEGFTGEEYLAHYPASVSATMDLENKTVSTLISNNQKPVAGSMDPTAAPMVAYAATTNFTFKNTVALAKFTVAEEGVAVVHLAADEALAGSYTYGVEDHSTTISESNVSNTITVVPATGSTFAKDETYYVAVIPGVKANLKLSVNGVTVKKADSFEFERNKIYNLGTVKCEETPWKVTGVVNDWDTVNFDYTFEAVEGEENLLVAKNVKVTGAMKFTKGYDWNTLSQMGSATATAAELNKWYTASTSMDSKDITVNSTETLFDIYLFEESQYAFVKAGEAAPTVPGGERYKIYAYNYAKMNPLYLYTWGGHASGTWPGVKVTATEVINGYTYYVYELPTAATGSSIQMIFNNGNGTQTADSESIKVEANIYVRVEAGKIVKLDDANNPEPEVVNPDYKIYVKNTAKWPKVYIYAWTGLNTGNWPGTQMKTETINGTQYYVHEFKGYGAVKNASIIFNNGSGTQTADITGVNLTEDLFYELTNGKNYKKIADPRK